MGRNIQKGLWLALAAVLVLVYRHHGSTHGLEPAPVSEERVASPAPAAPPGSHRLPRPIAAPPVIRQLKSSLRACHLRGHITNPGDDPPNVDLDLFRRVARSNELVAADASAEVGADGSFDFELPPGDYFVFAHDEEHSSALAGPFSLGLGEEVSEVDLTLDGSVRVEGLVIDDKGDPTSASVDVTVGDGTWKMHREDDVDSDGKLFIDELPHERLELSAINEDTGKRARLTLAAPERGLIVRLGEQAPQLTVHVLGPDGAPVEDASVEVLVIGVDTHIATQGSTDAEGKYLAYPRGDRLRVEVDAAEGIADSTDIDFDGDRDLEIRMRPGGTIRGRLLLPDGSVGRGQINLIGDDRQDESFGSTTLDENGGFEWPGLRAGHYLIAATLTREAPKDDDGTIWLLARRTGAAGAIADVQLGDGETRDLGDLRLKSQGSIRGVVTDERGAPVEGAMIEQLNANEESSSGVSTDAQGRFELRDVVGSHRLRALLLDQISSAVVAEAGDTEVKLTIRVLGAVSGVVHGLPPGPAWARCGDEIWSDFTMDGSIHLSCMIGSTMEVLAGGETHHYAINVDPNDTSYFELSW